MHVKHMLQLPSFDIYSKVKVYMVSNNYQLIIREGIFKYNEIERNKQTKQKRIISLSVCFIILEIFTISTGFAQKLSTFNKPAEEKVPTLNKPIEEKNEVIPFKSRIAFKTNAIDWLLIAPNATIELDISNSIYNKNTLSLGVKGNWNTYQKYTPSTVYNFLDVRLEGRHYWRTEKRQQIEGKRKAKEWMKDEFFSKRRLNPRYWRAYYAGIYINHCDYSFKFGKEGIQGAAYGLGLSTGFGIPLYGYNDKFIDLELGGSIGMALTKYEKYTHDRISNCYPYVEGSKTSWHVAPFPIINDLRVSFVFRFSSIKDKYKLVNHVKVAERQERIREKIVQKQEKEEEKRVQKEEKAKEREQLNLLQEEETKKKEETETSKKESGKKKKSKTEEQKENYTTGEKLHEE